MIKAIVFDFDGVIADSAHIKTQAFRDIFIEFGEDNANKIMNYHMENMGISRYKKFQYFFEYILKRPYSAQIGDELSQKFSDIVMVKIINTPFIKGALEFLEQNNKIYKMFIATGTPQLEIKKILQEKAIDRYFEEVFGSPQVKAEIVNYIIYNYDFSPKEMVFVGDAMSDYIAAKETGIYFIGRIESLQDNIFNEETTTIFDLSSLKKTLENIGDFDS